MGESGLRQANSSPASDSRKKLPAQRAPAARQGLPAGAVPTLLYLQRTIGNRAVNLLLRRYAARRARVLQRDVPGEHPQPSASQDQPGSTQILIDGDGDQTKELLLLITANYRLSDPDLGLRTLTGISVEIMHVSSRQTRTLTFDWPSAGGTFFPLVSEVTDGKGPTTIVLTKEAGQNLLIYPPTSTEEGLQYRAEAAGKSAPFTFSRPPGPEPPADGRVATAGAVTTMPGYEDSVEVTLGAYNDRFRLSLRTMAPESVDKALFSIMAAHERAARGSDPVPVALSGPLSLRVVDSGPVSLGLDLNGDEKPEIQLFDQLDSPSDPASYREHRVRATGPALGTDAFFPFTVRGDTVSSSMVAIGGITALDITLGPFGDQFRLTFQPTGPDRALFGISASSIDSLAGGMGKEIGLSGPFSVRMIDAGPAGVSIDLNGDDRAELQIVDQLDYPDSEADWEAREHGLERTHEVRVSGPALAAGATFPFEVRWGKLIGGYANPEEADKTAGASALAVEALAEQATRGGIAEELDAYERQMAAIRFQAAGEGVIPQATFKAWAALSRNLIALQPQINAQRALDIWDLLDRGLTGPELLRELQAHSVNPTLLDAAVTHAAAFAAALDPAPAQVEPADVDDDMDPPPEKISFQSFEQRLGDDLVRALRAGEWESALTTYRQLVGVLDDMVVAGLQRKGGTDAATQAESLIAGEHKVREIAKHNPRRLLAVFLPDEPLKTEKGYVGEVPLTLYYWKEEGEVAEIPPTWHLQDLTNPEKPHDYTSMDQRAPWEADGNRDDTAPPEGLLHQLNDPDRFPTGVIRYQTAGGASGEVPVTSHLTFKEFLTYLGLGLAAVGLVLAPFDAPLLAVASEWALAGSAVAGGLAAGVDLAEHMKQGDLNAKTAVLDIGQIVSSIAGVSALAAGGRISAAAQAGRMAALAERVYVAMTVTRVAADTVTLATFSIQTAEQLDVIESGPGSRTDKDRAKFQLLAQLAVTGGLGALNIEGLASLPGRGTGITVAERAGVPVAEIAGEESATGLGPVADLEPSAPTVGPAAPGQTRTEVMLGEEVEVIAELPEGSAMQADTPEGTREMYENSLRDDPHREVALYRNAQTGELVVVQGSAGGTAIDHGVWKEMLSGKSGAWQLEAHSHPVNPETGVTPFHQRFPSSTGGDFSALEAESRAANGQPRTSRIDVMTEHGPDHTDFTYDPNDPKPYKIVYPDPVNGKPTPEEFASREAYEKWYSETFPGRQAQIDAPPGGGPAAPGSMTVQVMSMDTTPMQSAGYTGAVTGTGGGVYRARVQTSTGVHDVVIKLRVDSPAARARVRIELEGAQAAAATGHGPPVYGEVMLPGDPATGAPDRVGFAMGEQEGGYYDPAFEHDPVKQAANEAEADANAARVSDRTLADFDDYAQKLLDGGHYYKGEVQGFVGPHGEFKPIDFETIRPLPPQGDPTRADAIATHWQMINGERKLLADILAKNKVGAGVP